jgi:hypothetical protein
VSEGPTSRRRRRSGRRDGTSATQGAAVRVVKVQKTYGGRLPVSGSEPVRLTKYEREKLERRKK